MIDQLDGIAELFPEMVRWRRQLHEWPELSFEEKETSAFIADLLQGWGIEVRGGAANHAVVGAVRGSRPGPTVALRADMDALPIQDEKACEYASKRAGVMHACGHDAHTAALLAAAKWFAQRRAQLTGTILFVFQHAEELSPGGAVDVLASGALDEAGAIYGVHLWTPYPVGHVYGAPGSVMAAADEFRLTILGRGGHGGLPHAAVDSVHVAAQTIVGLQSIVSRRVDPLEPCVVSVGVIRAGTAFNVIAERCEMSGTVRAFSEDVRQLAKRQIGQIAESTAAMHGARAELAYIEGYPPVVNDAGEVRRFARAAGHFFGAERVHAHAPIMAGEDFAYYLRRIPGCFLFVGAGNEAKGIVHPHHHPKFDIDETAMIQAAQLLALMALDYLRDR